MANKIKYGLKNCYYAVATIDVSTGAATYSAPVRLPGAVSISLDPEGDSNKFFADNVAYASFAANAGYTGTLEVAMVPDSFRKDVLGETETENVLFETADATNTPFALLFQFEGDDKAIKHVLYNCTVARTSIEGATTEDSIEVKTETMNITCGSVFNATLNKDIVKAKCADDSAAAYSTWFNSVYQPSSI